MGKCLAPTPTVKGLAKQFNISLEDIMGNLNYVTKTLNYDPETKTGKEALEKYLKYWFHLDNSSTVFYDAKNIENTPFADKDLSYSQKVKALSDALETLRNDIKALNEKKVITRAEIENVKKAAAKLGIYSIRVYRNQEKKTIVSMPDTVLQEKKTGKEKIAFEQAMEEAGQKKLEALGQDTEFDVVYSQLASALNFANDNIKFDKETHTYWRRLTNIKEIEEAKKSKDKSLYKNEKDAYYKKIDMSVSSFSQKGWSAQNEVSQKSSTSKALEYGNENDRIMRLYFESKFGLRDEERKNAAAELENLSKSSAVFSDATVKDLIAYADKIASTLNKIYGKGNWKAWAKDTPIAGKVYMASNGKAEPVYIAGMFDLVIYTKDGQIDFYDFKTSLDEYRFERNSAKQKEYAQQVATYAALLEASNPELAGRISPTTRIIQTVFDYTDITSQSKYAPSIVVDMNIQELSDRKEALKKADIDIFALDLEETAIVENGVVYVPGTNKYDTLLQKQRDKLYHSRDIMSRKEFRQAVKFITARYSIELDELEKTHPKYKGNRKAILRAYKNIIRTKVFDNFATDETTPIEIKAKRELIFNNRLAVLEYVEHSFRNTEGFSLLYDSRELDEDKHVTIKDEDENTHTTKEEQRADDLWRIEDANMESANLTLSKHLRKVFSTFKTGEKDAFGNEVYVDQIAAFNELRKLMDGSMTLEDMIFSIEESDSEYRYKEELLSWLRRTDPEAEKFKAEFHKGFRMQSIVYSTVKLEKQNDGTYSYSTYFVNTSTAERALLLGAKEKFYNDTEFKVTLFKNLDTHIENLTDLYSAVRKGGYKIKDDDIEAIADALIDLGFSSVAVTKNHIIQILNAIQKTGKSRKVTLRTILRQLVGEPGTDEYAKKGILNQIKDTMSYQSIPSYYPFAKSKFKNPLAIGYSAISKAISPYVKESVELTAYDNGKTYYSYSSPSFLSDMCDNINSENYEGYLDEEFGKYKYFKLNGKYLSKWLNDIYTEGEELRLKRQLNFNRTEYADLGEGAYALSLLAEFNSDPNESYAWFAVPTLSNKSISEFMYFRRYAQNEILESISKDVFLQELIQIDDVLYRADEGKKPIENYSLTKTGWAKDIVNRYSERKLTVADIKELLAHKKHGAKFGFLNFLNNTKNTSILEYIREYLNGNEDAVKKGYAKAIENVKTEVTDWIELKFEEYKDQLQKLGVFKTEDIQDPTQDKTEKKKRTISVPKYLFGFLKGDSASLEHQVRIAQDSGRRDFIKLAEQNILSDIDAVLKDYFYNSVFANINVVQITSTSLSFYKSMEEFQKRNAQVHSPKQELYKDAVWYAKTSPDSNERVRQKVSKDGKLRSLVIDDEYLTSEIIPIVAEIFDEELSKLDKTSTQYAAVLQAKNNAISSLSKDNLTVTDGQAFNSPTSYRKKTVMEGDGWTDADEDSYDNITFHNKVDNNTKWQVKKDFVYGKAEDETLRIMQQFKNSEHTLVLAGALLRAKGRDHNLLTALYDLMENTAYEGRKIVRDGYIYLDGNNTGERSELDDGTIIERGRYTGTGIDTILFRSNVKHSQRGVFKYEGYTTYNDAINALNGYVFRRDGKLNIDGTKYDIEAVQTLDFSSYGIQQPVPAHYTDNFSLIGSQMRILSISGFDENTFTLDDYCTSVTIGSNGRFKKRNLGKKYTYGELVTEYQELQAQGIEDSVRQLKREFLLTPNAREKMLRGIAERASKIAGVRGAKKGYPQLRSELESLVNKKVITKDQKDILNDKAYRLFATKSFNYENWIDGNEDIVVVSESDQNAVLSALLKDYILRDTSFGVDLLEAVELNPDGTFVIPLGESMHSVRIQQLLNSIVRDRIWKQMAPGGPIVQVAGYDMDLKIVWTNANGEVAMSEEEFSKSPESANYNSYKDYLSAKKFRLSHMECYAPVPTKEFEEALEKIGHDNGVNYFLNPQAAVDAGIISAEMLKLIGYRIPTENKYSIIPMVIKGFLPSQSGEGIILPKEITAITGSDFDVDKLYVLRKHFYELTEADSINKSKETGVFSKFLNPLLEAENPELKEEGHHKERDKIASRILSEVLAVIKKEEVDKANNLTEETEDNEGDIFESPEAENLDTIAKMLYEELKTNRKTYFSQRKFMDNGYNVNNPNQIKRDRKKRQNRIFDIQWALLTSRQASKTMFNPQSFDDLKKIGYVITLIKNNDTEFEINGEKRKLGFDELMNIDINTLADRAFAGIDTIILPQTTMYFQHANTVANSMVGIFANQNVSHAFCSLPGIKINYIPKNSFTLGGVKIVDSKLDPLYSFDGLTTDRHLASYLAAAVDAAKANALAPIGINKATVNVITLLSRLGFTPDIIALFVSQPIIQEVVAKYEEGSIDKFYTVEQAIGDFITEKKLEGEYDSVSMEKDSTAYTGDTFSKKNLERGLTNTAYTENALRILHLFAMLKNDSVQMEHITFATKFNSRSNATGPMLSDTLILKDDKEKYQKLMEVEFRTNANGEQVKVQKIFEGTDVLEASPLLKAFYDASIGNDGLINAVFEPHFPHLSTGFDFVWKQIRDLSVSKRLSAKDVNKIMEHFMYYILTVTQTADNYSGERAGIFNTSDKERLRLMEQFPIEVAVKKASDDPDYVNNKVIQCLFVNNENTKAKFPVVEFRTSSLGKEHLEDLKLDWEVLLEKDPQFALDIINYGTMVNAFSYSPKTGLHNTPIMLKYLLGGTPGAYINAIRKVTTMPSSYMSFAQYGKEFIKQFFRNNSNNKKLVTKVNRMSELHLSVNTSLDENAILPENNKSWTDHIKLHGEPPVWIMYRDKLYYNATALDPETKDKTPNYIATTPLGVDNTFVEYNASKEDIESVVPELRRGAADRLSADGDGFEWAKEADNGYEVSTSGDARFSALNARLKDGRTIEEAYQLDIKGYRKLGYNWRQAKADRGVHAPIKMSKDKLYQEYLALWQQWAAENPGLIEELRERAKGKVLTDIYAADGNNAVSQARALADILNATGNQNVDEESDDSGDEYNELNDLRADFEAGIADNDDMLIESSLLGILGFAEDKGAAKKEKSILDFIEKKYPSFFEGLSDKAKNLIREEKKRLEDLICK